MKLLKYILSLAILMSTVSGVYAAEDSGALEALKMVKERVDTSEYSDFRSNYYRDEDGKTTYSFTWSKDDGNSELYISVDGRNIVYYGKSNYSEDEGIENKLEFSKEQAVESASEFIKKINPDIYNNIKIVPETEQSIYSDGISLDIYRTENGIPVLNETGYVEVSKLTHEVTYFYINYNDGIEFTPIDSVISEADAKKAYTDTVPLELRYRYKTDYKKMEITPYIEYALDGGLVAINAIDGSLYEGKYDGYYLNDYAAEKSMGTGEEDRGLSPAELEETEKIAGLLSEDAAEQKIRANTIIGMPKDFVNQHVSFNRDAFDKEEYSYYFNFGKDDGFVGARVDAKTGEILNFYKYEPKDFEDKQNRAKEEKIAKKAFEALAGDKASEFRLEESEYEGYVRFIRTYDELDVVGDSAYFSFDGNDNITEYSLSYKKNVEFPSKDGVVSPEKAFDTAFDKLGFELGYAIDYNTKKALPVYYIGKNAEYQSFTVNPFTATLTDYDGEDRKEPGAIVYTDIDNHYGKNIFMKLAEYGIGFESGMLKPDEPTTQSEFFTLLNQAFGYGSDKDEIYKNMIYGGIIKAEDRADDSLLTRENAAIFMIREIGAEEYAKYNDIFVAPFDDVTENKGYVAILKAKGVINGDGSGNFYPKNTVTRGEALIMLYNYLSK